jgi:hypothetical protein
MCPSIVSRFGVPGRELEPVSVGVEDHALVVSVAGSSRPVEDRVPVESEPPAEIVDRPLVPDDEGQVNEPRSLRDRVGGVSRDTRSLHDLEPRPGGEP